MGFLAPWFIGAGVLAAGLPIWLHLLRKYRTTPLPFSSLMFFDKRPQSSVKHRRLRYLLLMSLRIALLLLLAFAFARPFLSRSSGAFGGRRLLVIAVDRSFSMRDGDRLARAKERALGALSRLSAGERGEVLALDSQVEVLAQPTDDASQLRSAIQSITSTDRRSSYAELARSLRSIAEATRMPLEVHFATDDQKTSMPPAFGDLQLGPATELVIDSVASGAEPNWAVESVSAPAHIYDPKRSRVQATIAGYGTAAAHRTVSLVVDGRVVGTRDVDVPANGRVAVEFPSLESPYGFHRGEVRIDSADRLKQDDSFPFSIERTDPRRVLFLYPSGNARAPFYYRTALESAENAGFALDVVPAEDASGAVLSKFAYVVIADAHPLDAGLEQRLRGWVNAGGAVLVTLGPESAALSRVPVSGESVMGTRYSPPEGERFRTVDDADQQHPALKDTNRFAGVEFYQSVRIDASGDRLLARLSDGSPLIAEKQMGAGRVMVFTSGLDNVANDLPLHASFVPFVVETARYLAGDQQRVTNVAVGAALDLNRGAHGGAADVIDVAGHHLLTLAEASAARVYTIPAEGFYEIHDAAGKQWLVAAHADRAESDLTPASPDTLALWRETGREPMSAGSAAQSIESSGKQEFWRWLLLLAVMALLAESFVASRYLATEKEQQHEPDRAAQFVSAGR
jgi:hypothetical protein